MADRASDSALSSMIETMSAPQPAASRAPRIPPALAVVVVAIVAVSGGWLVYRAATKGHSAPVADVVELGPGGGMGMRFPSSAGIVSRTRGAINVRGMDFQLRATRSGENAYTIAFDYPPEVRRSWVTPEQWEMHQIAQRATSIPKFARHINLSDEQRKQLQALSPAVELSAADVQRLRPYLSDWDRAKDPAVQQSAATPLIDAAQQVAAARRTEAKAAQLRRVQEIPKILTAEQRKLAETYILPAAAPPSAAL
jgi:hypothetical protein